MRTYCPHDLETPELVQEYVIEVPIDYKLGRGKQNIDFAYYKAEEQDLYCFEIKISKSDFNSSASLSFDGNYNYLVADKELADYLYTNWHNRDKSHF